MRYRAHILAFDLLGEVEVRAGVYDDDHPTACPEHRPAEVLTSFAGVGESDPREWLRDALVALLEAT